ncbi:MAG: hypothetical protein PHP00_02195 [Thiotrichaceae bacterium]|nr:hypothetical protein [Thiotrichaceae bacterium]
MKVLPCLLMSIALSSVLSLPVFAIESEATRLQQEEEHYLGVTEAINDIKSAKIKLEETANEFGGHKNIALHALDEALNQLQVSLEFAKTEKKTQ